MAGRTFRFLLSPVVRRLIVVAIVLGLLFAFRGPVLAGLTTAWNAVWGLFGWGIVALAAALVLLVLLVWQRRRLPGFFQGIGRWLSAAAGVWNQALGAIALLCALFGVLAFFGLGGALGAAIIGAPDAWGILRLVAIVALGVCLIAPRQCWRLAKRTTAALAAAYRRRPLHRSLGRGAAALGRALWAPIASMVEGRRTTVEKRRVAPRPEPRPRRIEPPPVSERPEPSPPPPPAPEAVAPVVIVAEPEKARPDQSGRWQLPSISILDRMPEVGPTEVDTERGSRLIEESLASYGVEAKVVQVNVGPAVTQYGVEPGWDRKYKEIKEKDRDGTVRVRLQEVSKTRVKVDRIASLANDLALALSAPSIKIEAPVPGKPIVGIEVPNSVAGMVSLRSIIESPAFARLQPKTRLPLALGQGVSGEAVVADLTKMPHLLIAGATGSGKSVCIKSVLVDLIFHATPDELRLLLIDPKRVELVSFAALPHLAAPVVYRQEKAVNTLNWLNREMDRRYEQMAAVGARDIEAYNRNPRIKEAFPYLVLVIDELADLMAAAPDEVERTVCRLAQLARATGIHLILATQRPSVDVVTGLIKANFPARISFAVTAQVDSRTILDAGGAEKLLGRGDMLFLAPDAARPKRLQGSFVSDAEIERLVSFWIGQHPREHSIVPMVEEVKSQAIPHEDPMLARARRLAQEHKRISTSFLQRRLGIGYPRAARIMDMLEQEGLVERGEGPAARGEAENGG